MERFPQIRNQKIQNPPFSDVKKLFTYFRANCAYDRAPLECSLETRPSLRKFLSISGNCTSESKENLELRSESPG